LRRAVQDGDVDNGSMMADNPSAWSKRSNRCKKSSMNLPGIWKWISKGQKKSESVNVSVKLVTEKFFLNNENHETPR
jgi:hypothetical protein